LHELIAERYERTATIITSNLDFSEWDQAFPSNPLLASATLDRLRHNAYPGGIWIPRTLQSSDLQHPRGVERGRGQCPGHAACL
jgi:hypothetical protein